MFRSDLESVRLDRIDKVHHRVKNKPAPDCERGAAGAGGHVELTAPRTGGDPQGKRPRGSLQTGSIAIRGGCRGNRGSLEGSRAGIGLELQLARVVDLHDPQQVTPGIPLLGQ